MWNWSNKQEGRFSTSLPPGACVSVGIIISSDEPKKDAISSGMECFIGNVVLEGHYYRRAKKGRRDKKMLDNFIFPLPLNRCSYFSGTIFPTPSRTLLSGWVHFRTWFQFVRKERRMPKKKRFHYFCRKYVHLLINNRMSKSEGMSRPYALWSWRFCYSVGNTFYPIKCLKATSRKSNTRSAYAAYKRLAASRHRRIKQKNPFTNEANKNPTNESNNLTVGVHVGFTVPGILFWRDALKTHFLACATWDTGGVESYLFTLQFSAFSAKVSEFPSPIGTLRSLKTRSSLESNIHMSSQPYKCGNQLRFNC